MIDLVSPLQRLPLEMGTCRRSCILIGVMIVLFAGCGKSPNTETLEKLRAAEEAFTTASTEKEYGRAAQLHQQVVDAGFVSGQALYNQGNAYLKSNQSGRAIAAYRQALRYRPRDGQLVANLETALGEPMERSTRRTVWDYVLIWQRSLSYREKYLLTTMFMVVGLGLFWYSRWYVKSVPLRRLAIVIGLVSLLFAGSSILDWHRIERQRNGVLTQETAPRKGNSDNYEPAFTRPLPEGTEFVVEERRGEWIRGRFADDAVGWLPIEMAVVY